MLSNDEVDLKADEGEESYKKKYRELKKKLKYLVYENECFENDIKEAQLRLLQLGREKSFLLDQLMVHETIVLSDQVSMDSTDYESTDDERSSTYSEMVPRKSSLAPNKAPPSTSHTPSVITSSPKQTPSSRASRANASKKPTGRAKTASSKAKASSKNPPSSVTTPTTVNPKPPLIVSLPISASQPRPPKLIPSVFTKRSSPIGGLPSSIGGKDKGGLIAKKPSPPNSGSSSTGSSSSSEGSSDESGQGGVSTDSTSDSEPEPMDTMKPHPPPLIVMDPSSDFAMSNSIPQPMESPPIRIMPPSRLTSSLNTIPLLSPSVTMPMTTPIISPTTPIISPSINYQGVIFNQHQGGVVTTQRNIFNNNQNNRH